MQCNSGSFTGMFGSSVCENAKVLLANGLVDLLGSDGHRSEGRNTDMSRAAAVIRQLAGEEVLRQMTETNPQAILKNQEIELKQPKYKTTEYIRQTGKNWKRLEIPGSLVIMLDSGIFYLEN